MKGIQKALLCIAVVALMLFTGFGASVSTPRAAAEMTAKWGDKLGKPIYELKPDIVPDLYRRGRRLHRRSPACEGRDQDRRDHL